MTIAEVKPRFRLIADEGHLETGPQPCRIGRLRLRYPAAYDDVAESEVWRTEEGEAHPSLPENLAAIILSSGTTGRPKQVLHTHVTLTATAMMAGPVYGVLGPSDSMVVPMAPSFAAWIHTVLPLVAQRCTIVFQRRYDTDDYVQLLDDHGISIAALVPSLWRMVLPVLSRRDLPRNAGGHVFRRTGHRRPRRAVAPARRYRSLASTSPPRAAAAAASLPTS